MNRFCDVSTTRQTERQQETKHWRRGNSQTLVGHTEAEIKHGVKPPDGFVTSFATAAVELGMTLMLVSKSADGPLSYGIYVYMQSAAGRGPGAALGIAAVIVVGLCTMISYIVIDRRQKKYGMQQNN